MAKTFHDFIQEWHDKDIKQRLFIIGGLLCLLLTLVGLAFPVMPQIPFAILAAFMFSKGSQRLHHMMRENKYVGKPIKDWEDYHVVRPKLKITSALGIAVGVAFAHWKFHWPWAVAFDVLFAISLAYVLTRQSKPRSHHRHAHA